MQPILVWLNKERNFVTCEHGFTSTDFNIDTDTNTAADLISELNGLKIYFTARVFIDVFCF